MRAGFTNDTLAHLLNSFDFENNPSDKSRLKTPLDVVDLNTEDQNATKEDEDTEIVLMRVKLTALELEIRKKNLEIAEKDSEITAAGTELTLVTEENRKLKDASVVKDELNEVTIAKLDSLEELVKKKEDRNKLLEPLICKFLDENKKLKAGAVSDMNPNPGTNDPSEMAKENERLKSELKATKEKLKTEKDDKSTLAKELAAAQSRLNTENKEMNEKCIKLTNDVKIKSAEIKMLERENKFLTENSATYQKTLNEKNNKIAEVQIMNTRLENFNKKMYEICEKRDVFSDLERANAKEIESQKSTIEDLGNRNNQNEAKTH